MKKNKNLTTAIVIVAIIMIATISAAYYQNVLTSNPARINNSLSGSFSNKNNPTEYRNGVYDVTGSYISPGGAEKIGVILTLQNGIIVDSEVEVRAEREISLEMQTDFAQNYKGQVVGRNIDEVELTKVSGSSLTPNGFNDAVEKIKQQSSS